MAPEGAYAGIIAPGGISARWQISERLYRQMVKNGAGDLVRVCALNALTAADRRLAYGP